MFLHIFSLFLFSVSHIEQFFQLFGITIGVKHCSEVLGLGYCSNYKVLVRA